ncbi:hypothetical protein WG66_013836 [Moniliophthora roreri]|nr:hypothetical protein WG66_013836 [Moniliophthora roreri]
MDVLRSNEYPSEAEIAQMKAVLEAEEHQMEQYDREISHLLQSLSVMQEERKDLERRIRDRRSWFSPVRKLPVEILTEIMALALLSEGGYSLDIHYEDQTQAAPLHLSHVSSHWRTIVTGTPYLWSSLSVDVFQAKSHHHSLIELFIERSNGRPLKLKITDSCGEPPSEDDPSFAITYLGQTGFNLLWLLMQQLPRCEELRMDTYGDSLIASLDVQFDTTTITFPVLSSFQDQSYTSTLSPRACWYWESIRRAPNLTHVEVSGYSAEVPYPYSQLKSLIVGMAHDYPSLFRNLSSASVDLEELRLEDYMYPDEDPAPASLHSLQRLAVTTGFHPDRTNSLFDALTVPSLSCIEFRSHSGYNFHTWQWNPSSFNLLLERSSCTLSTLSLHHPAVCVSATSLLDIFRTSPNASHIELDYVSYSGHHSSAIAEICNKLTSDTTLTPHLQELFVHERISLPPNCDAPESVIAMLESRTQSASSQLRPLVDVRVFFCDLHDCYLSDHLLRAPAVQPRLSEDLSNRLQRLKDNGIECIITIDILEDEDDEGSIIIHRARFADAPRKEEAENE